MTCIRKSVSKISSHPRSATALSAATAHEPWQARDLLAPVAPEGLGGPQQLCHS